jgi:hypothetical protein
VVALLSAQLTWLVTPPWSHWERYLPIFIGILSGGLYWRFFPWIAGIGLIVSGEITQSIFKDHAQAVLDAEGTIKQKGGGDSIQGTFNGHPVILIKSGIIFLLYPASENLRIMRYRKHRLPSYSALDTILDYPDFQRFQVFAQLNPLQLLMDMPLQVWNKRGLLLEFDTSLTAFTPAELRNILKALTSFASQNIRFI